MKREMNTNQTVLALAIALLAMLTVNVRLAVAGDCDAFWDVLGPGDWFEPSNWSDDSVPGPCDEVGIHNGGPVTIQFQPAGVIDRLYVGVDSDFHLFENAQLLIQGGGSLTATGVCEINSFYEEALIDVNGAGSELEVTKFKGFLGELYVGTFDTGTLNVGNGGTVSCIDLIAGEDEGSVGTVSVTGGGTINTSGNLAVGGYDNFQVNDGGNGSMTIEFGGIVNTTGHGNIGNEEGGNGTVVVSDADSAWNIDTDFRIGRTATGSLTINDGAAVNNRIGSIGDLEGAVGTATVTDSGSTWTNNESLFIGQAGDGTLNIENGGGVNNQDAFIANTADALGIATVTGDGSTWNSTGQLAVGKSGMGTLNIVSGGHVTSLFGRVGHEEGSTGEVEITGTGSRWDNTDGDNPDDLHVGLSGTGFINLNSGGQATSRDGTIGFGATGIGFVDITDSDSSWTVSRDLRIGVSGTGTLTLLNSGTLAMTGDDRIITLAETSGSVGTLNIGDGDSAGFVDAASVSGGDGLPLLTFNHNEPDYHFTSDGTPDGTPVLIQGAAQIKHIGSGTTALAGSSVYSGSTSVHSGTLRIIGSLDGASAPVIVGEMTSDGGTLHISDGGTVTSQSAQVAVAPGSTGHAAVTGPGSIWTSHDGNNFAELTIGLDGAGSLEINDQGLVECGVGTLGSNLSGVGTAMISGDNSEWTADQLFVGRDGAGELTVHSGGAVNCAGLLRVAENADSTGTINIGNGNGAGVIACFHLNGGSGTATINFNHTDDDYFFTRTGSVGGIPVPISGNASVNHLGTGKTTFTASHTYAGPTTIDNGTLVVVGEVGNSITTVNAGGTLAGIGLLNEVFVEGGTISPGVSAGTLAVASLTLDANAVLEFELDALANPNDMIDVNGIGDLVLDGTINITDLGGLEEGTYTIITYTGEITDNGLEIGSAPVGFSFTVDTTMPGEVTLNIELGDDCPADISDPTDGEVNTSDLLELLANWGSNGPGAAIAEPSDVVDTADLLQLLAAWGSCR